MATRNVETYDQDGNLVETRTVEVSDVQVAREQAQARLKELYAKGWANLTASEKAEVPKLVVELLGS